MSVMFCTHCGRKVSKLLLAKLVVVVQGRSYLCQRIDIELHKKSWFSCLLSRQEDIHSHTKNCAKLDFNAQVQFCE